MEHICFSLRAALCLIVLESLISVGFAQVLCTNPLNIGELRVLNSKKCVDTEGATGVGNVLTFTCGGGEDQQLIICGDGTIRNQMSNYCLQPVGSGNANTVFSPCSLLNGIPARQRWRLQNSRAFTDIGGITQVATQIINIESNKCLDVTGSSGDGNIGVYNCGYGDDQYFFVRSRGREVAYGRLRNERSNLCVDVEGSAGTGNVLMWDCGDSPDQFFHFYENGEIINEQSGFCLDVEGSSGDGNVLMYTCGNALDQHWGVPNVYCNGDSCSFLNKQSGKCMDVLGSEGRGNILTWQCGGSTDQRFKWVADKWETPTASWINVGCNQNGKVSQQISNTVSFENTIESTTSVEISSTISAGVIFAKTEVSATISTSLALAWTSSRSGTTTITYTCDNYDNGEEFTRGCMWQMQLDMNQVKSGDLLTWNPQIVKCTRSSVAPRCAPFTRCVNEDCNFCEEF